jgi:hypothetical protein
MVELELWISYDSVGDGHCVAMRRAAKMLAENSFLSFISQGCLNISGC